VKSDHLKSDKKVSELSCVAKLLNFHKQSIGFAKFIGGHLLGGSTVFHFTVNLDGYVFQNVFDSSPLFGRVSLNFSTDTCSIKKNQVIRSHFPKT